MSLRNKRGPSQGMYLIQLSGKRDRLTLKIQKNAQSGENGDRNIWSAAALSRGNGFLCNPRGKKGKRKGICKKGRSLKKKIPNAHFGEKGGRKVLC